MGIDVYLEWDGITDAEKEAQVTGFSTMHGHIGYLREAYHGGPYATAYLITEDWDRQPEDGFVIPAAELKRRLPAAVLAATYRNHVVYENGRHPANANVDEGGDVLAVAIRQIMEDMPRVQEREFLPTAEQRRAVSRLIADRKLPGYALAFVNFVDLAKAMEKKTGKPCRVVVSH